MNWKEFLKPHWKKIILAIIILSVLPFPFYNVIACDTAKVVGSCPQSGWTLQPFLLPIMLIHFEFELEFFIYLILFVATSYLISCLIISKVRKK
ncbi:MAG: hypothetical protein KJ906_00635 [Nanoarchaeota archaeon]|nr:hypothetical protein [Nanoarchaeota archaeon]